jgi:hypothetical protein
MKIFEFPPKFISIHSEDPVNTLAWSPDSRGLLLKVIERNNPETSYVMIFDIDHAYAFQVAKDVRILGWMKPHP